MSLGLNIKRARKNAGLRQADLANLLGVSANYITQIESGRKRPPLKLIDKISDHLDVKILDILDNDKITLKIREELRTEILEEFLAAKADLVA